MSDPRAAQVHAFWFEGMDESGVVPAGTSGRWFSGGAEIDAAITRRFGDLVHEAAAGGLREWETDSRGVLSLIIVLDQFTRNIFRDDPRAFSLDERAQQLTLEGLADGIDAGFLIPERHFFYMPLMHAEDQVLQVRSLECFQKLAREADDARRAMYDGVLAFAVKHKTLIDRFGRYPHRNRVLGRESTAEEIAFLEREGRGF